ncbi:hypothetical protein GCM10007320_08490 [Pseudorhodoferax aquiterrae]|uniref:Uncharacterized protein n=1 Tax=Pseudorhodoferax aquiterrae TaxID=747304 RepID=A0ABQ3FXF4_9BURK|nr:hypothetical protein [Pseudorhodoferax aquiterrae]GHC72543.1 hypothetical protein GCM10007320_08490 [Pseudorhodoferax aquiterrae]
MTLAFDSTLSAGLALATTKLAWCELLITNLGATRRFIAKTGNWASGTTFRDYDLTGTMSSVGAAVRNFGVASNARVRLAADITAAPGVARISNAGQTRWVQGSYGVPASTDAEGRPLDANGNVLDFTRSTNPTAEDGDAVNIVINPPAFLPSGTGPAAPLWHSQTPKTVVLESWATGSAGAQQTVTFDDRGPDLVMQHPQLAAALGDVAWWRCSQEITHGTHIFGFHLFRAHAGCSRTGDRPLEQIMVFCRPVDSAPGDWSTYPAFGNSSNAQVYDKNNPRHSTYPAPFKLYYRSDTNVEVGRCELHDGKPVNDKSLAQDQYYDPATGAASSGATGPKWGDAGAVIRPHWNCAQPIIWSSDTPADMPANWFWGVQEDALRPMQGKRPVTFNPLDHLLADSGLQFDHLGMIYSMAPWPRAKSTQPRMEPIDPYCANPNGGTKPFQPWGWGYAYEPGSRGGIDIYPAPGGSRSDRAVLPATITMFLSDREGVRLEGQVPWRTLAWEWCKNYANVAGCFVRNPRTGEGLPKNETLARLWAQRTGYYGSGSDSTNLHRRIEYYGASRSSNKNVKDCRDSTGRNPYGYQLPEGEHHGYTHAGIALMAFRSPVHVVLQRHHYDMQWMARLGARSMAADTETYYGNRPFAWRWCTHLWSWFCAADHPLTYTREQVESGMQTEMEKMHTDLWIPTFQNDDPGLYFQGIKRFGAPMTQGSTRAVAVEVGGNKFFYTGLVAMLMKTTGMWDTMKARSIGCERVLGMVIHSLDKASVDWVLGTQAHYADSASFSGHMICTQDYPSGTTVTSAMMPASWYEVPARLGSNGDISFFREDANPQTEWDAPQHNRAQWPSIHKAVFATDYPNPDLDAAINLFKSFYLDRFATSAALYPTDKGMESYWNCGYRIASMGFVNAPPTP